MWSAGEDAPSQRWHTASSAEGLKQHTSGPLSGRGHHVLTLINRRTCTHGAYASGQVSRAAGRVLCLAQGGKLEPSPHFALGPYRYLNRRPANICSSFVLNTQIWVVFSFIIQYHWHLHKTRKKKKKSKSSVHLLKILTWGGWEGRGSTEYMLKRRQQHQ